MQSKQFAIGTIDNVGFYYILGDTVWFYENCATESTPYVGVIVAISEDNMVDLQLMTSLGQIKTARRGVCLQGDERLNQAAYKTKGCWRPRPTVEAVHQYYNSIKK